MEQTIIEQNPHWTGKIKRTWISSNTDLLWINLRKQ